MSTLNPEGSTTFCAAPWISRYVTPTKVTPCCFSLTSELADRDFKLLKQQLLTNKKPSACARCWRTEDAGTSSARQLYNSLLYSSELSVVEVQLHSICNLSCNICSSEYSSSVKAEQIKYPEVQRIANCSVGNNSIKVVPTEYLSQSTVLLKISGGEPFLLEQPLVELLTHAITVNSNIAVRINTNGSTVVTQPVISILKEFKELTIVVSLDDVGQLFEYHRYGGSFATVTENIKLWKSNGFTVGIHCAVSLYNIASLVDIYNFCAQHKIYDIEFTFVHSPAAISLRRTSDNVASYVAAALSKISTVKYLNRVAAQIQAEMRYRPTVSPGETLEFLRSFNRARKIEVDELYPELVACLLNSTLTDSKAPMG